MPMSQAAYHRQGQMIPMNIRLTGLDTSECFVLELNHREYPMHTTELVELLNKTQEALVAWFQAMPDGYGYPEQQVALNPDLKPFAVMAGVIDDSEGRSR